MNFYEFLVFAHFIHHFWSRLALESSSRRKVLSLIRWGPWTENFHRKSRKKNEAKWRRSWGKRMKKSFPSHKFIPYGPVVCRAFWTICPLEQFSSVVRPSKNCTCATKPIKQIGSRACWSKTVYEGDIFLVGIPLAVLILMPEMVLDLLWMSAGSSSPAFDSSPECLQQVVLHYCSCLLHWPGWWSQVPIGDGIVGTFSFSDWAFFHVTSEKKLSFSPRFLVGRPVYPKPFCSHWDTFDQNEYWTFHCLLTIRFFWLKGQVPFISNFRVLVP